MTEMKITGGARRETCDNRHISLEAKASNYTVATHRTDGFIIQTKPFFEHLLGMLPE